MIFWANSLIPEREEAAPWLGQPFLLLQLSQGQVTHYTPMNFLRILCIRDKETDVCGV